jgi:DNA (cytosine-5)-methyltransferase 1
MSAIKDLELVPVDGHMHRVASYSAENIERMKWLHSNVNQSFDLPPEQHNPSHQQGTTYKGVYGRLNPDAPAGTITTGFMTPGRGRYVHPTQMRTLTPHEAARIQGFPDSYRFQMPGEKPPTSALLTKWIGDAVPMPLGYCAVLAALGPGLPNR